MKTIKLTVFAGLFWLAVFAAVAYPQTGQNTSRWDLYSGKWDLFTPYRDNTTSDTVYFNYKSHSFKFPITVQKETSFVQQTQLI